MRQNMEQKAADKFRLCKGHRFGLVIITAILVGECHPVVVNRFYPVIGNGALVCVAVKIDKNLFGVVRWGLTTL